MYGCGGIVSVALYMPVLAGKIFGTQADGFCLDGSSCRPTVTYITVACSNVRIDGRCGYCASLTLDERTAYRQPVERMNHQAAYYVFVIILVFQIDALSVHNGKVITNLFLEKVAVNKESHITAAIRTVQGIAAIDTCQIVDRL